MAKLRMAFGAIADLKCKPLMNDYADHFTRTSWESYAKSFESLLNTSTAFVEEGALTKLERLFAEVNEKVDQFGVKTASQDFVAELETSVKALEQEIVKVSRVFNTLGKDYNNQPASIAESSEVIQKCAQMVAAWGCSQFLRRPTINHPKDGAQTRRHLATLYLGRIKSCEVPIPTMSKKKL